MAAESKNEKKKVEKQEKPENKAPVSEVKAEGTAQTEAASTPSSKKKGKRSVPRAVAHILSTFNNTIITITDPNGETLCWDSAGTIGYKGSRKSTPFAAQRAAEKAAERARKMGVREMDIKVKGPGAGRESAVRALAAAGIRILAIEDVTPLPHNGCRPRKRRRV